MAKAKRKGQNDDGQGPSRFFIIVLILGFVVLVWMFLHFLPKRATNEEQGRGGLAEIGQIASLPPVVACEPPTACPVVLANLKLTLCS